MKIALLVPNFVEYSGDARVVAQQAEELSAQGHDVSIFAFAGDIITKSAKLHIMGMPKSMFWQRVYRLICPLDFFKMHEWVPKLKDYDKIIAHLYPMTVFAYRAKKRYNLRYVFWFHGLEDPNLFPHFYERMYMKIQILLTRYSLKNVDQAVSVSRFAQMKLKEFTGIDSIVEYNKVDGKLFHKNIDGSAIRKLYNLGKSPVILSIGRLVPQKKVDLLIKSFHIVKKSIPTTKLVIIGKPTFEEYYKELKRISDNSILFINFVPYEKLPFFYAMCDIYATCSYWENHNLPVLEAQMCGKPVIAFDIEAFKEEIDSNGIIVEKGNIQRFAQACITKINEQRHIS